MSQDKAVSHPDHYTSHPSGVECIQITEHMGFNLGNALKYIWRADLKHASPVQDLEKAMFYIARELEKIKKATSGPKEKTMLDVVDAPFMGARK